MKTIEVRIKISDIFLFCNALRKIYQKYRQTLAKIQKKQYNIENVKSSFDALSVIERDVVDERKKKDFC